MNTQVKRVAKKALAVLLTIAMLVSMLSVTLTAFADTAAYTVTARKPAIPAKQGTEIDLSKIDVVFENGNTYRGTDLTWSTTDKTGGVLVGGSSIAYLGADIYAVEATNPNKPEETMTIYLMQPDETTGEAVLYDHTFTSADLTTDASGNNVLKPDSEWAIYTTMDMSKLGLRFNSYYGNDVLGYDNGYVQNGIFYIKPDSSVGKMVSAFPDITTEVVSRTFGNPNYLFGPLFRMNLGEDKAFTSPADEQFIFASLYSRAAGNANSSTIRIYNGKEIEANRLSSDDNSYKDTSGALFQVVTWGRNSANNDNFVNRTTVQGTKVICDYKLVDKTTGEVISEIEPKTYSGTYFDENMYNGKGTVGFGSFSELRNMAVKSFKALITFTAEELAAMNAYLSDILVIPASKPALPMSVGKTLNLSSIYIEFDDGTVALGSDINWFTEETTGGVMVDNTAKTVTLLGTDIYKIKATSAKAEEPKVLYVFTPDANNSLTLINYTFSSSDAGKTDANGVHTFGGASKDLFKIYSSASATVSFGKLQNGNGSWSGSGVSTSGLNAGLNMGGKNHYLVINPDSAEGKIMSDFADYTITYRGTLHPNFVSRNCYDVKIVGRYDMAGASPNFANDTFLGYRAPFNNGNKLGAYYNDGTGAAHYVGNATTNGAYVIENSTVKDGDFDFKLKYEGENLTAWSKTADAADSAYVQLFTTVGDPSVPAALKNTVASKGTFAVASYAQEETQLTSQKVKVAIEFTDEELKAIADRYADRALVLVRNGKPAIAMPRSAKLDLSNVYVEFDGGIWKSAKDITWSTTDTTGAVIIDNNEKSITLFGTDFYAIEARVDADTHKTIYVFEAEGTEKVLVDYTFSADDDGTTNANGVYTFGGEDGKLFNFYATANKSIYYGYPQEVGSTGNSTAESPMIRAWINKGLYAGGSSATYLTINPNSKMGSIMADFADYTIVYRGTIHPNFVAQNSWVIQAVGRYQMADGATAPKFSADSYLGYNLPIRKAAGSVSYTGNKSHTGNSVSNPYYNQTVQSETYKTVDESDFDFKMQYKGNDLIVSVKGETNTDSEYKTLYTMSLDGTAPAIETQTGTFAVYSSNSYLNTQKVKVAIEFTEDELANIASQCDSIISVTNSKPAIAMPKRTKLSLNNVFVEFNDGTWKSAKDLTWSTDDTTGGIAVDDAAKTITLIGSDFYKVTASVDKNTFAEIYVFEAEGTEKVLLDYTFTAADAGTPVDGVHTFGGANNDLFKLYTTASSVSYNNFANSGVWNGVTANQLNAGINTAGTAHYLVLNPNSSVGQIMSNFGDYTITYRATRHPNHVARNYYGVYVLGKYSMTGTSPNFAVDTFLGYDAFFSNTKKGFAYYNNGTGTESYTGNSVVNSAFVIENNLVKDADLDFKFKYEGENLTAWSKAASSDDSAYVQLFTTVGDFSVKQSLKDATDLKGTFAVYSKEQDTSYLNSQKLSIVINFTDEELKLVAKDSTKLLIIERTNPLIPIESGKKVNVSDIYFQFDDGMVVLGKDITWTTEASDVFVDNANTTIAFMGTGFSKVTASYKAGTEDDKTYYVTTTAEDGTKALINYKFSAADAGTTDENGVYTFGGDDDKLFQIYLAANTAVNYGYPGGSNGGCVGKDYDITSTTEDDGLTHQANVAQGIYSGGSTPIFMVNPNSIQGSIMADFADLTIVYRGNIHPNFVSRNSFTIPIAGKYQMAEGATKPSFSADTFVGYNAPLSSAVKGGMYYNVGAGAKTYIGDSAIANPYRAIGTKGTDRFYITESDYDFRMQYKGDDFTVSVKGETNTDDEYVTLYTTVGDTAVPEALANISSLKGTFMATTQYLSTQYFKVTLAADEDIVKALKATEETFFYISATNPAIPMEAGKKADVSNIYFELDNGKVVLGKDITWTPNDTNVLTNSEAATIAYLDSNVISSVTATYDGKDKIYYVLTPEADNTYSLINYTFSSSDAGKTDADGVHTFGGANKDLFKIYSSASATVSFGKIQNGSGSWSGSGVSTSGLNAGLNMAGKNHYLVINPDSAEGKIMSDFADYTITYRGTLHPNFVSRNYYDVKIVGRYDMAGASPNFANDTFLGYRAPFNNGNKLGAYYNDGTGAAHYVGNATTNGAYVIENSTVKDGDFDFKLKYEGENLTAWSKTADAADSAYVQLFTTVGDPSVPAALKNTVASKGTFAVASYAQEETQLTSQKVKVVLEFEADIVKAIDDVATDMTVIPANNATLPMSVNTKLSLNGLYFQFDSGVVAGGSDITWELPHNDIFAGGVSFNSTHNELTIFKANKDLAENIPYELKATYNGEEKIFYAFVPDENGEQPLLNIPISSDDLEPETVLAYNGDELYNFIGFEDVYDEEEGTFGATWKGDAYAYNGGNAVTFYPMANGGVTTRPATISESDETSTVTGSDAAGGTFYINPESEAGMLIKNFRNISVETIITPNQWFNGTQDTYFGPIARLQVEPERKQEVDDEVYTYYYYGDFYTYDENFDTVYDEEGNPVWDNTDSIRGFANKNAIQALYRVSGGKTFKCPHCNEATNGHGDTCQWCAKDVTEQRIASENAYYNTRVNIKVAGNSLATKVNPGVTVLSAVEKAGAKAALKLKVMDDTVETYIKNDIVNNKNATYTQVTGIELTEAQQNAIGLTNAGTVGFTFDHWTGAILHELNVAIAVSENDIKKLAPFVTEVTSAYTVTVEKPGIPVEKKTKVDLNNAYFEFENGMIVQGAAIDWSVAPGFEGKVFVDSNNNTAVLLTDEAAGILATIDGADPMTYYLVPRDEETGDYVLYNHTFSKYDIEEGTYGAVFTDESEWTVSSDPDAAKAKITNRGIVFEGTHKFMYLRPESVSGQMVSAFGDIGVETQVYHAGVAGMWVGNYLRLSVADGEAKSYVYPKMVLRNYIETEESASEYEKSYSWFNVSTENSDLSSVANTLKAYIAPRTDLVLRTTLSGTKVIADVYGYQEVDLNKTLAPFSIEGHVPNSAITNTDGGTIGVHVLDSDSHGTDMRVTTRYIKAFVEFNEAVVLAFKADSTPVNIIDADKPAIAMAIGQTLNLDNIVVIGGVDGAKDTLIYGNEAEWSFSDEKLYYEYYEDKNTILAFTSGYATLTATVPGGATAVIYLTVANSKGEYVIYDHKFSQSDLETVTYNGTAWNGTTKYERFTKNSEWAVKGFNGIHESQLRLGYNLTRYGDTYPYSGMSMSYYNVTSQSYSGMMYLRPDSVSGIKVSAFSDIIFDYSASLVGNGNNSNALNSYLRLNLNSDTSINDYVDIKMLNRGDMGHYVDGAYKSYDSYSSTESYERDGIVEPTNITVLDYGSSFSGYLSNIKLPDGVVNHLGQADDGSNTNVSNYVLNTHTNYWFSFEVNGETATVKTATDANFTDAVTTQLTENGAIVSATDTEGNVNTRNYSDYNYRIQTTRGGTIGFAPYQFVYPVAYKNVTVKLSFTGEEMAFFANFVEDVTDIKVVEYEDISKYKGENAQEVIAPAGKVFAGWFKDVDCTESIEDATTGKAYAKFITDDVFGVKWQISEPSRGGSLSYLRLVSSIDNLKYKQIGFNYTRTIIDEDGIAHTYKRKNPIMTNTVFEKIIGDYGTSTYDPSVFSDISKYFVTAAVTGTDWNKWSEAYYAVTTLFETQDGTMVEAPETIFKLSYDDQAITLKATELRNEIADNADLDASKYDKVLYVSNTDNSANYTTIEAAVNAANADTSGKNIAILLKRGDTFRIVGNTSVKRDKVSIGAYGTGAKPKVFGSYDAVGKFNKIESATFNDANLNSSITAPEGTDLWTIDLSNIIGWLDMGAVYFINESEYGKEDSVIVADKKWNRAETNKKYNEAYDKLAEEYDFFFDYATKKLYVLLPDGVAPTADNFSRIEIGTGDHAFEYGYSASADNATISNLDIRYANYGVVIWGGNAQNVVCRGLEIGWIGGARVNLDAADYSATANFTRCGNGIEIWGGQNANGYVIDNCYVYECYDAGITFQNSTSVDYRVFENIKFTNNLLVRNTYNIEYFLHSDLKADNASDYYLKDILFEGNICRDAGGTQDDLMWGTAYRPDKGVATHIKGGTTSGNNTMLTDGNGNYTLTAPEGQEDLWKSSFVIRNNIFDSSVNTVLGVSAANEGGEPIFENNMYVQAYGEGFGVSGTNYNAVQFKNKFDPTGDFVSRYVANANSVYASARTINTAGGVEIEDTLGNTYYKLKNGENLNVAYIGGSVTSGNTDLDNNDSYADSVTKWLESQSNGGTVTMTNAGIGGTSSQLGFYRIGDDVLKYKPDLVFIEFAINDVYSGVTEMNSHLYMEGMVKKIREANPQTDIVILLIGNYSESYRTGDYPSLNAHKTVAEHYGVPYVNIAEALYEVVDFETLDETYGYPSKWVEYFVTAQGTIDEVHPNATGYQFYGSVITDKLGEKFAALEDKELELTKHVMPQVDLVSNNSSTSEIVKFDGELANLELDGFEVVAYDHATMSESGRNGGRFEKVLKGGEGATLEYTFTGKEFGLWYSNMTNAGGQINLKVTIDGSVVMTGDAVPALKNRGSQAEWQIVNNLSNGRHTIKIEVLSSASDFAICGFTISK